MHRLNERVHLNISRWSSHNVVTIKLKKRQVRKDSKVRRYVSQVVLRLRSS